ncbi:hypothetical protein N431DRAFT_434777 [Stipitochalara longipes BDJ]|nr:hypothetical protein N431DRAFT_434777 [Stipitochalara longipes BDJ]
MATTTYTKGRIPLRNLPSSTSITPKVYTPSITSTLIPSAIAPSTISTTHSLLPPSVPFLPTSSLQIQTQGKALFRLPSPLKDLEIPILSTETGRPVYLSIREKRSSGSCTLVDAESEEGKALASTVYHWGPGKNPVVKVGDDEFEIQGKSMVSRSMVFECRWGKFEWRYAGRKERNEGVSSLLVLEKVGVDRGRVKVAQLVRGEETRSPGSSGSSAGNGGRLDMRLDGEDGSGDGKIIDEQTVVSTCLVMLKKEVDRRRALQVAMISIAISGH